MSRERYREPSASGDQAPQTVSRDQAPQISSSHGLIYYRAADLAQRFGVHPVTVWKWVQSGNLPQPTKLGPGVSAWRSDVLERWEAERSAAKKTA
ncbi:MAG: helix-turn-helix transcriptional regulator [Xanthobacteraceae bacterium]